MTDLNPPVAELHRFILQRLTDLDAEVESMAGNVFPDAVWEGLGDDEVPAGYEMLNEVYAFAARLHTLYGGGVTPAVTPRLCACGCGYLVTSPRPEAKYAEGSAHRMRALRERSA